MAVLSAAERAAARADAMQANTQPWDAACLKTNILTAVNNLDDFFETNQTQINNQFPTAIRSVLTTEQKARLVIAVIRRRYLA